MFDMWFHLDMSLLLTIDSPSINTLRHLPPIPLLIDFSDHGTRNMARKDEENISFGLQWHDRVCQVDLRARPSSLRMWLGQMNQFFPRLGGLSLLSTSTEELNLVLPETFQAPDLRRLTLHGIGLSTRSTLLPSAIALSTLSLTHIGASSYLSPGHLVKQLQGLPHLKELSIGFAIPIPLPSTEGKLLPAPIPPVTLPSLRRLTFRGVSVYLDNLVAQINAPILERLNLTLFFELAFTLVNLGEFISRAEGFGFRAGGAAQVSFNKDGANIDAGYKKSGYYEPWDIRKLSVFVNCEPLDWQIDSAMQICNALAKVLLAVEELKLVLNASVNELSSDSENTLDARLDDILWHELLLPFIGVKELYISSSLTHELSQVLGLDAGGLALELFPELQKLHVPVEMDNAINVFSHFVKTREFVGRPIHLVSRESIVKDFFTSKA
jgi:hypothetical protein